MQRIDTLKVEFWVKFKGENLSPKFIKLVMVVMSHKQGCVGGILKYEREM